MSRLPDWEDRLASFLMQHRNRPFEWGQWDCALFATACAAEITGLDCAAVFREQYSDRIGSAKALRDLGKGTLTKTLDDLFTSKPVGLAGRGDLVWAADAVGVCMGSVGLFVGENDDREGLVTIERAYWTKAWAV